MNFLELIKSKKFKVAAFSVLSLISAGLAEQMPWSDVTSQSVMIVIAYLAAQGIADFGKGKPSTNIDPLAK